MAKIYKYIFLLLTPIFALCPIPAKAQSLVSDISTPLFLGDSSEMFTETVRIISRSQRIFILTNTNQMLNKGDFITLVLPNQGPVARALVGKISQGQAGIKILKVYSLRRWSFIRTGIDVQILKGDDSKLFEKPEETQTSAEPRIGGEEDLYSLEGIVDDDLDFLDRDTRHIKPDNLVGGSYSQFSFEHDLNPEREKLVNTQLSGSWAFQFSDNYWAEALYGRAMINDFPAMGTQTLVNNFTVRLKYTFKAPLYSYIMPYLGYQIYSISSPEAGKGEDPDQNIKEEDLIAELGKDQPVFGVTVLRRLVPGWFLKADLGNDILSLGFAIEF